MAWSWLRPRFHVLISVYTASAIAIGTQPPCSIFTTFARRNDMSMRRKNAVSPTTCGSDQFHRDLATTANRMVVTAIVPVTAMPYAALSALELRNISTSRRQPTMSALFTSGM